MIQNGTEVFISFDPTKVTAREAGPHVADVLSGRAGGYAHIWALTAIDGPLNGANDPETYLNLPLDGPELPIIKQAFETALNGIKKGTTFATFNLKGVTAREYDQLMNATGRANVQEIAKLLARFVTACPAVKDVSDPEAWLDTSYYAVFMPVANKLRGAGTDLYKRFLGVQLPDAPVQETVEEGGQSD